MAEARSRAGIRAVAVTSLALGMALAATPARAASRDDRVAGRYARIYGVTKQASSLGEPTQTPDSLDLTFGDTTFSSTAVSGDYVRKGHKLRFQIDPARLAAYQASWEAAFRASLEQDGLDPDSVDCAMDQAKVKGRVRKGAVKFKTKYRLHCAAEGAFGERVAKAKVRFQGRGPLTGIRLPFFPGNAGGTILAVGNPSADPLSALAASTGQAGLVMWVAVQAPPAPPAATGSAGLTDTLRRQSSAEVELRALQLEALLAASADPGAGR